MPGTPFIMNSTIMRAGAGAGKTTRLISTIFNFIHPFQETNQKMPKIVVCTFTRKATQELKERLLREAISKNDWSLVRYVNSSALHISTIHGVLGKFLALYGYRLGLDPQFRFIDAYAGQMQAKKLIRDIMVSPLLGAAELELISQTFTVAELAELSIKFYETTSLSDGMGFGGPNTFQELFSKEISEELTVQNDFTIQLKSISGKKPSLGQVSDWVSLLEGVLENAKGEGNPERFLIHYQNFPKFRVSSVAESYEIKLVEIRDHYKDLRSRWERPEYQEEHWPRFESTHAALGKLFNEFSRRFREQKIKIGELQVSDLEVLSLDLIRKYPDTANLFSVDWDFWLVDEYQDTSPIQVELIKNLQGNRFGFTVGDPQQSIYLFRGARCEVFSAKEEELKKTGGSLELLDTNYRSRPALVEFFNSLFKSSQGDFIPMKPGKSEVEINHPDVSLWLRDSREEKLQAVLGAVSQLIVLGEPPDGICVLARTNEKLKNVARGLAELNIPCLLHAAGGFYDRREILDALALLKFILNPHDNINLVELLRSPWFHLEDQKILESLGKCNEVSFWTRIIENDLHLKAPIFEKLLNLLNERESKTIVTLFKDSLRDFGFLDYAHYLDMTGRREANLWKLILNLEEAVRSPGFNYINFVRDAINDFDLEADTDQDAVSARDSSRVNLMTVHQSKGLEFDHVIVMDIDENPIQGSRQPLRLLMDENKKLFSCSLYFEEHGKSFHSLVGQMVLENKNNLELTESQRVFYVAVTRAAKSLALVGAAQPHSESWQSLWKLSLTQGIHDGPGFKYFVSSDVPPLTSQKKPDAGKMEVRAPQAVKDISASKFLSVSQLVNEESVLPKNDGHSLDILERANATSRGVLVHRLFEAMKYKKSDEINATVKQFFPNDEGSIKRAMEWARNLSAPPIKELLEVGHAEWGFIFSDDDGSVIEGQIDLWGQIARNIWIVDYKTGSSHYSKKAFDQMRWYARALKSKGVVGKITLAALYPFEEKIELKDFEG